ncbi:MAG: hypothetical protein IPM38_03970 [Ignavibacteria bacterium]|nr:hypothetical protein [Ignavibacteria bacterium]
MEEFKMKIKDIFNKTVNPEFEDATEHERSLITDEFEIIFEPGFVLNE